MNNITNNITLIDFPISPEAINRSPNLAIYLDLLSNGALSNITAGMVNVVSDHIYNHINWSELSTILTLNNSPDTYDTVRNSNFRNLYSVSELDTKNIPNVIPIINEIVSDKNHHIHHDLDISTGWSIFAYINAYLDDITAGNTPGSFLNSIA